MSIYTFTLWLPEFWASALINGDFSGLNDDDEKALRRWIKHHPPQFSNPTDVSDMREFRKNHDADGYVLPCDCAEFSYSRRT